MLCYGLNLPLVETETIKDCVNIYCKWLTVLTHPEPSVPSIIIDDPNAYVQVMFRHLHNVFVPRVEVALPATQGKSAFTAGACDKCLVCLPFKLEYFKLLPSQGFEFKMSLHFSTLARITHMYASLIMYFSLRIKCTRVVYTTVCWQPAVTHAQCVFSHAALQLRQLVTWCSDRRCTVTACCAQWRRQWRRPSAWRATASSVCLSSCSASVTCCWPRPLSKVSVTCCCPRPLSKVHVGQVKWKDT